MQGPTPAYPLLDLLLPVCAALIIVAVFVVTPMGLNLFGVRRERRRRDERLDCLKSLAGAIESARSKAIELDVPVVFHLDDVHRHLPSQLVVLPGDGKLLFEPLAFSAGTGSVQAVTVAISDPETGWRGRILIDSSGLVIRIREREHERFSTQHSRPFPLAMNEAPSDHQGAYHALPS